MSVTSNASDFQVEWDADAWRPHVVRWFGSWWRIANERVANCCVLLDEERRLRGDNFPSQVSPSLLCLCSRKIFCAQKREQILSRMRVRQIRQRQAECHLATRTVFAAILVVLVRGLLVHLGGARRNGRLDLGLSWAVTEQQQAERSPRSSTWVRRRLSRSTHACSWTERPAKVMGAGREEQDNRHNNKT